MLDSDLSLTSVYFAYNDAGIRKMKQVWGEDVHTYELDGTKILKETWGNNVLIPLYDNEDSVCGAFYNDMTYYFEKNLQGDVIAVYDELGYLAVRYSYDAWGKVTKTVINSPYTDFADINPFLYRGYYYDWETGLYYLQSRYYDPELGRFINADECETATITENSLQTNLFAYCGNDPVNNIDERGNLIWSIIKKILLGIILGLTKQFFSDVIQFVYANLFINGSTDFKFKANEYLSSILVEIGEQFIGGAKKGKAMLSLAVGIVGIAVRYLSKIIGNRMNKRDWINLTISVTSLILSVILMGSSEKLRKQRSQIRKKLRNNRKNVQLKTKSIKLSLKIKYKGLAVKLYIPISQEFINLFLSTIIDG